MTKGFIITKLVLTGKGLEAAIIDFKEGLNVITGPTGTGKSFIFDCINYMLGGKTLDRVPPEATNYDKVFLEILSNNKSYTLERATKGGQYNLFQSNYKEKETVESKLLIAKHDKNNADNISTFLLDFCNLSDKEIRFNNKGKKVSLSYRDICHLSLIPETEITKLESPIFAKGGFQKTKEINVINFLVTGQDDNAVISEPDEKIIQFKKGKLEILDELINSFGEREYDPEKLESDERLKLLEENILKLKNEQSEILNQFVINDSKRKNIAKSIFNNETLLENLKETLSRSELLKAHYHSDINRLNSTIEAGLLLSENPQNVSSCPYCSNEIKNLTSENEILSTVASCENEIEKINFLLEEVQESITLLEKNKADITSTIDKETKLFLEIEQFINNNIRESLKIIELGFTELYSKRDELLNNKFKRESIEKFIDFKSEISNSIKPKQDNLFQELTTSTMFPISEKIHQILEKCNYSDLGTVSFSESTYDFVIGAKNRNLSGKGERAITYATFVLALAEYLIKKEYSFGIPVFDSPLVTYRKPNSNGEGISEDLAMDFYRYCASISELPQIIILENEEPTSDILDKINHIKFTKNKTDGRYGFIPN